MLDDVNNQLKDKDKVCKEEKEILSHEITALKGKLSSSNDELKNSDSKNKELAAMLDSSRGRLKKDYKKLGFIKLCDLKE